MSVTRLELIAEQYKNIQDKACSMIGSFEAEARFSEDPWSKEIGQGLSRVLQGGDYIEKAAINFSRVSGNYTTQMAKAAGREGRFFSATGISSIIHPVNPHAPIIHMNVRYFELDTGTCWFGGGIDLTPHYVDPDEARYFHKALKTLCDAYHPSYYPDFKAWADDYFFIRHRNETRGIGGIFFDHLEPSNDVEFQDIYNFTLALGKAYPEIYTQLLKNTYRKNYTAAEKEWQQIRRSRYVEFNLIYDRGTKFGLESGGNPESILVSMPPMASWKYQYQPHKGSREEETLRWLKKGINWISST